MLLSPQIWYIPHVIIIDVRKLKTYTNWVVSSATTLMAMYMKTFVNARLVRKQYVQTRARVQSIFPYKPIIIE
jgi:hypothetical protein